MAGASHHALLMAEAPPLSFTYIGGGVAASSSIAIPAGAAIGDFVILMEYIYAGNPITIGTPSGWSIAKSMNVASNSAAQCFYQTLPASSGTIVTGSSSSASEISTGMFVFRPNRPIVSITPSTWNGELTTGTPLAQTVDPSAELSAVILAVMEASGSSTFALDATPACDGTLAVDPGSSYANFGRKLYNTGPASHVFNMTDEGTRNAQISGYFKFT